MSAESQDTPTTSHEGLSTHGIEIDKNPNRLAHPVLPAGSSRQVVRRALFEMSMRSITSQFDATRSDRRALSRRIAKDLWRKGERLTIG